jgi:16S rRNA G527 N7-methylase RsmG
VAAIGLTNVHVEHAHAAHWRPILRGSGQERLFDMVVVRALAPLGKCLQLCAAFVKPRGWLVAYKTASLDRAELAAAERALRETRMRVEEPFPYELQMGDQTLHRTLHLFQRVR